MKHTLIFIDTETTGAGADDRLIQVAYRTTDGVDVNELYSTTRKIEIGAMAVHHITEKMIQGKPLFTGSPVAEDLAERFNKSQVFIAHNANFDKKMVEKEGLKVGPVIDTLKVARHLDPKGAIESYALQYLRYLLGIEVEATAHDAWGDILVLEQLFYRMLKKMVEEQDLSQDDAVDEMIRISNLPTLFRSIPFGKYRGKNLKDLADTDPGYLKWLLTQKEQDPEGPDEDWIYSLKHYLHL